MDGKIRDILNEYGHLVEPAGSLGDEDDLYLAGLTSHATVNVMLALEDEFTIEFPEPMLRRSTFQSIAAIRSAVSELVGSSSEA
jgi:acyl carrier protein